MRNAIWAIPALLAGTQLIGNAAEIDRVARGTQIVVRTIEPIRLDHWDNGRIYQAEIARNVRATDGDIAFPRGATANLIVRRIDHDEMVLDLNSVDVHGRRFMVDTSANQSFSTDRREGVGANRRTGKFVGGGAIIGSIIGAIAGGGKGAAIGAASGAAAGAGAQMATRGHHIYVPSESVLTFQLDRPLRFVDYRHGEESYYERDGHRYHRQ